jgi:hypothetical protein
LPDFARIDAAGRLGLGNFFKRLGSARLNSA